MKEFILSALLVTCIVSMKIGQGLAQFRDDEGNSGIGDSGNEGGPQCPTDGCPVDCYCNDDPHMKTFDNSYYEMQQEGKFFLYKHSTQPIWVQGFFQSCGYNGAFCSCGAAVRYFGETFVVDKCERTGGVRANVVAKLGTGTSLRVDVYFSGYKISVPGALRVFLGSYGHGIGTISVRTNLADLNSVGGLCGNYSGYPSDDFTWRSGQEITAAGTIYPYDFADSWRVQLTEDLFNGYALDNLAPCDEVASSTFVPPGVADACFLNITPSAMIGADSNGHEPTGNDLPTNDRVRHKRQAGTDYPNGEWPNGFNHSTALSYCTNYLFASQAVSACTSGIPVTVAADPFIDSCARDIQLTGGTLFASVSRTALLTKCMTVLETYSITSPIIEQGLCPFDCSGNGVCLQGLCICNSGWSGISCYQAVSQTPSITSIAPSSDCPLLNSNTVCYSVYLFGGPFVSSSTLLANGLIYKLATPGQTRSVQVELTYISTGVLGARIRPPKCPWNRVGFAFSIRVSNDGVSYSSTASITFNL